MRFGVTSGIGNRWFVVLQLLCLASFMTLSASLSIAMASPAGVSDIVAQGAEFPTQPAQVSTQPGRVRVPNVIGRPLDVARRVLEAAGLRLRAVTTEPSEGRVGVVTAQDPPSGTLVPPRTEVRVRVTAAVVPPPPRTVEVPNVIGQRIGIAEEAITRRSLRLAVTREPSDKPAGIVISQDPPGGSLVPPGTVVHLGMTVAVAPPPLGAPSGSAPPPVTVLVEPAPATETPPVKQPTPPATEMPPVKEATRTSSSNPTVAVIPSSPRGGAQVPRKPGVAQTVPLTQRRSVPAVGGRPFDVAKGVLEGAGFRVGNITSAPGGQAGIVIGQNPLAGTMVAPPLPAVNLTLSAVKMPDVVGQPLDRAARTLEVAGFRVGQDGRVASGETPGTVIRQDPAAGVLLVPPLPAVGITVAALGVPDVVGRPLGDATRTLAGAGFRVGQDTRVASGQTPGTVVRQNPAAGVLSLSPLPAVDLAIAAVGVPNVVGQSLDAAQRVLRGVGLNSTTTGFLGIPFASVVSQTPLGGMLMMPAEGVVTLRVGIEASRWGPIVAGALLAVVGSIAASKAKGRHGRGPARVLRTRARCDPGAQEIRPDVQGLRRGTGILLNADVRFRPVLDQGSQSVDPPTDLLNTEEGSDHV